jgi:hypothetical protein
LCKNKGIKTHFLPWLGKQGHDHAAIFGGTDAKLIVAYTKNRSIGARLIKARH